MSIRATIVATFEAVAAEHGRKLAALTDDLPLLDCGLDSLCFAIVVAQLEESLDTDPFGAAGAMDFPVSFGDFVGAYEQAR